MLTRRDGFQQAALFRAACEQLGTKEKYICLGLNKTRQLLIAHYHAIEANLPESVDPEKSGHQQNQN